MEFHIKQLPDGWISVIGDTPAVCCIAKKTQKSLEIFGTGLVIYRNDITKAVNEYLNSEVEA